MTDKPETTTPVVIHSASDFLRGGNITIDVPTNNVPEEQLDRLANLKATGISLDEWGTIQIGWTQARIDSDTLNYHLTAEARIACEQIAAGAFAGHTLGQMPLFEQGLTVAKCVQEAVEKSGDRTELIARLARITQSSPDFEVMSRDVFRHTWVYRGGGATEECYFLGIDAGDYVTMKLKGKLARPSDNDEAVPSSRSGSTKWLSETQPLRSLLNILDGSQPGEVLDPMPPSCTDLSDWQEAVWCAILLSEHSQRVRNINKLNRVLQASKAPIKIEYTESDGVARIWTGVAWLGIQVVPV